MSPADDHASEPDDREVFMQDVLTGDIPLDDPRVLALPPEARQELERLLGVRRALQQQAALNRALEAEVDAQSAGPVPTQVERFLRERRASRAAPRSMRRALAVASIAAGVLLLIWVAVTKWQPPRSQGSQGGTLSGAEAIEHKPVERSGDNVIFRWRGELQKGTHFVVHVFDWDNSRPGNRGNEIVKSGKLKQSEWHTTKALVPAAHIWWRVDVEPDEGGGPASPGKLVDDPRFP
jgi:hypothetical protein